MKYKFFALLMIVMLVGASQVLAKSGKGSEGADREDLRGESRRGLKIEAIVDAGSPVTMQQAIDKAKQVSNSEIEKIEQEVEDGVLVWKARSSNKADVRIDAQTGAVLRAKVNGDDKRFDRNITKNETIINSSTNVTRARAISIALNITNGTIVRVEQGIENNTLVWKVRLMSKGTRVDIYVDATTGAVLRNRQSNVLDLSGDFNPGKNGPGSSQGHDDFRGNSRESLFKAFLKWMGWRS